MLACDRSVVPCLEFKDQLYGFCGQVSRKHIHGKTYISQTSAKQPEVP